MQTLRSRQVRRKLGLVIGVLAMSVGLLGVNAPRAEAAGPFGPDTCLWGFVWREANPSDHVCVTSATRNQTALDNSLAASRRSPTGGPYGPDTCKQGFVWREAFAGDHVCVTPATRSQAAADNAAGPSRRALDLFSVSGNISDGQYVRGNAVLDLNPNGSFSFRGHLHNNGFLSYDVSVACVVKLLDGSGLAFTHSGFIKGDSWWITRPFSGGNKNLDWNKPGISGQVANDWAKIPLTQDTTCRTSSSLSVSDLITQVRNAVGIVTTVVAIV
jgi:hypothetical protein